MPNVYPIQQTTKRIRLLSAFAAVVAFPAALGFAWLWLIEGRHGGLLGFVLLWLLVAGVSLRVYAQFLRWWHQVDYFAASMKGRGAASGGFTKRRLPARKLQDEPLVDLEERLLALGAGRAIPHAESLPTRRASKRASGPFPNAEQLPKGIIDSHWNQRS
jgi:hypothetical protein